MSSGKAQREPSRRIHREETGAIFPGRVLTINTGTCEVYFKLVRQLPLSRFAAMPTSILRVIDYADPPRKLVPEEEDYLEVLSDSSKSTRTNTTR